MAVNEAAKKAKHAVIVTLPPRRKQYDIELKQAFVNYALETKPSEALRMFPAVPRACGYEWVAEALKNDGMVRHLQKECNWESLVEGMDSILVGLFCL